MATQGGGEYSAESKGKRSSLVCNALFALLLVIYGLLAVVLRSYTQPLLALLAVPFGFVRAIRVHYFKELPFEITPYIA